MASPEATAPLPSSRGVLALFSAEQAVLVTATANVREAARRKLAPPGERGRSRRGVDFASITTRIEAYEARTHFEGRMLELDLARHLMPDTYRNGFHRMQTWCIALHPQAGTPRLEYVPTHTLDEVMAATTTTPRLLGPIRDKHKAGRGIEQIVDIFELCRFPAELARSPRGTPCVYKEMGRCPAACDGSEPLDAYRARMTEAEALASDPDAWREALTEAMRRAAEAMRFEVAAALKRRLDESERLLADAGRRWMTALEGARLVVVCAADQPGQGALLLMTPTAIHDLGMVDEASAPGAGARLEQVGPTPAGARIDREDADRLAFVCDWMYAGRHGAAFAWWRGPTPPDIAGLLRSSHRSRATDEAEDEAAGFERDATP